MMMTGSLADNLLQIDIMVNRKPNTVLFLSGKITMNGKRYVYRRLYPAVVSTLSQGVIRPRCGRLNLLGVVRALGRLDQDRRWPESWDAVECPGTGRD